MVCILPGTLQGGPVGAISGLFGHDFPSEAFVFPDSRAFCVVFLGNISVSLSSLRFVLVYGGVSVT